MLRTSFLLLLSPLLALAQDNTTATFTSTFNKIYTPDTAYLITWSPGNALAVSLTLSDPFNGSNTYTLVSGLFPAEATYYVWNVSSTLNSGIYRMNLTQGNLLSDSSPLFGVDSPLATVTVPCNGTTSNTTATDPAPSAFSTYFDVACGCTKTALTALAPTPAPAASANGTNYIAPTMSTPVPPGTPSPAPWKSGAAAPLAHPFNIAAAVAVAVAVAVLRN